MPSKIQHKNGRPRRQIHEQNPSNRWYGKKLQNRQWNSSRVRAKNNIEQGALIVTKQSIYQENRNKCKKYRWFEHSIWTAGYGIKWNSKNWRVHEEERGRWSRNWFFKSLCSRGLWEAVRVNIRVG